MARTDMQSPGKTVEGSAHGTGPSTATGDETGRALRLPFDAFDLSEGEVRDRFRWARKQGKPGWLWPEADIGAWRLALVQIEEAIRQVVGGSRSAMLEGDIPAVGLACYTSCTGPLLGWWVREGRLSVSPPLAALLDLHLRHNQIRTERMQAEARHLVGALTDRGIDVAVLKGAHTGPAYFADPATRCASDIDLLVRPEQAPPAEEVLRSHHIVERSRAARESSWMPADMRPEPRSLMLTHADDPWSIDLHISLNLPVSSGAPLAALDRAQPMNSSQSWAPVPAAKTLPQPLLLLHLAVHASAGLQNLTLLRLVELHLVIQRDLASGILQWGQFLVLAEQIEVLGFVYPALRLCENLAPGTIAQPVLDRCARAAPSGVVRVVSRLTPATAQRIDRNSLSEYLMWTRGWRDVARLIGRDLIPTTSSWKAFWSIYDRRLWRVLRGKISR